ncbi:hypothetical protein MHYP_G00150850 [Metynnis hypsauchen]
MQNPSLLLLLIGAASLLTSCGGFGNRRLCGIQLVEALLFVCGEKGLFYQPGRRVRQDSIRVMMKDGTFFPQEVTILDFNLPACLYPLRPEQHSDEVEEEEEESEAARRTTGLRCYQGNSETTDDEPS